MSPSDDPEVARSDELPAEPEPVREITLDEWIAASQSCCGIDHDDDDQAGTT